jgi:2-octaprenyl-3-methyl-6-methoxy-1,4-benzoquinol hydroxylase
VLLLEGAPAFKEPSKEKYSNRVSAINKQSIGLLKKLDAWNHIESIRCKHIMQMQVWDAISNETIHFNHPNFNDKIACIVENDLILEALYKQLSNLLNVQVKNLSRLEACKLPKDGVQKSEVTLKSGEQFSCDLLVSFSLFIQFLS